jgi:hypothetical protein
MKLKTTVRFNDLENNGMVREVGKIFEVNEERGKYLLNFKDKDGNNIVEEVKETKEIKKSTKIKK